MRVAVLDLMGGEGSAPRPVSREMTIGFASHTVLPSNSSGSSTSLAPFQPGKNAPPDRPGNTRAVRTRGADFEVLLTVPWSGMDGTRALFERHVIAQKSRGI